ncbi:MAG: InlB B-repeat-containing protein [Clostridia bacterium]|nr:InlB B-repeat-containing protein [Clostridia bacterium]
MSFTKRWLSVILCVMMAVMTLTVSINAAGGETNVSLVVGENQVNVGDTFTVELGNKDMKVKGFTCGFYFDKELLECVSIVGVDPAYPDDFSLILTNPGRGGPYVAPTAVSSVAQANENGTVGYAYAGTSDVEYRTNTLLVVTFKALAAGVADITHYEATNGTDAYSSEGIDTVSVTIVEEEEEPTPDCSDANPHEISLPYSEVVECTYEDKHDHYYKWTASKAGTLTIVMPYALQCDVHDSGIIIDGIEGGTLTVEVVAGDVIILNVYNLASVNGTWTVSFAEPHVCAEGTLTKVDGLAVTCEADGYKEYYQCSCGTYYADSKAAEKIDDIETWKTTDGRIASSGHVWEGEITYEDQGDGTHVVITRCINDSKHQNFSDPVEHTFDEETHMCVCNAGEIFTLTFDFNGGKNQYDDTTMPMGIVYGDSVEEDLISLWGECTRDGYTLLGYTTVKDDADTLVTSIESMPAEDVTLYALWQSNHVCGAEGTLTYVEGQAAICTENGTAAHYKCSCGELYSDEKAETKITAEETIIPVDGENHAWGEASYNDNGDGTHTASYVCGNNGEHTKSDAAEGHDHVDGKCICGAEKYEGWTELEDKWYYYDPDTNTPVTGIARVPYPTELGYGPDAEAIAYSESKGETFIDEETGLFVFDNSGVFQSDLTGPAADYSYYVKNGHLAWHPGLIKIDGEFYYFIGDVENGGNTLANGEIYLIKPNGYTEFEANGIYSFVNGKFSGLNGIHNGKYYINSQLAAGEGLVKLDDGYIYVRSNGNLAVGEYWVTKTNGLVSAGMYTFGDDGFLVSTKDPSVNGIVDGCYYKNGEPYYAGLIEIDGDTYYVRSNGQLATGKYYITKTTEYTGSLDVKSGDKLNFGEDGKLIG